MGSRIISKNARSLNGFEIADTIPTDGQILAYQQSSSKYIPSDSSGGGNISNSNLTFDGSYYADLNSNEWSIKNGSDSYFNIKSTGEFVLGRGAQNLSTSSQKYKNTIVGYDAETTAVNVYATVSVGNNATTSNNFAVAIGNNAISSGASSISILGTATKSDSIAIGKNTNATGNFRSICLGANSSATYNQTVAIGSTAQATHNYAQAFGTGANATQTSALAVGYLAKASAIQGIAIGTNNEVVLNHNNSIVIGSGVSNTAGNQLSSTATNQFVVGFDSINPTILIGATTDSYIKSTGNLSLETNTTVKGSDNAAATSGFKVTDVNNLSLLEVRNNGYLSLPSLPSLSAGVASGDVWSQNGTLRIGTATANIQTVATATTLTANIDVQKLVVTSALASALTIAAPTGTPIEGQELTFRIKDDGTARGLTWNAIFVDYTGSLPTTTVAGKTVYIGCKYNAVDTKWDVVAVQVQP